MPEITEQDSIQQRIEGEQQPEKTVLQVLSEAIGEEKPMSRVESIKQTKQILRVRRQQAKAVARTSVGDTIEKLQEKILLLQYVESVKVPDVPTGNTKEARELLLQVGRDIEQVKAKAVEKISKL